MNNFTKSLFSKLLFITLVVVSFTNANGQEAYLKWVKQISPGARSSSVAVDQFGNVYVAGNFSGTVDFDPGPGIFNMTVGGTDDGFVCKLDSLGNFKWAKQFKGTAGTDLISVSLALDMNGNVYTSGSWEAGTVDFDPGPGTYNLTPFGAHDIFVSKLDTGGNFLWAKQLGGTSDDESFGTAVDNSGNVITTGHFEGVADFDPGTGVYNLVAPGSIFVSKLDASGNFVWAKKMGGGNLDFGNSVQVDGLGSVYTTGTFSGFGDTGDFDPGPGKYTFIAISNDDGYVSKLDASGNFVWAKQLRGTRITSQAEPHSIFVDANKNVYITGDFSDSVDFDPGPGFSYLKGIYLDDFILKLDASGNYVWAKQITGPGNEIGYSISVDTSGYVYSTGEFTETADFDPGPGTYYLTASAASNNNTFISKLDRSGNFVWAKQFVSDYSNVAYSIVLDPSRNIYTTGYFGGLCDFDPGPGTYNLSGGSCFVHKMGFGTTGIDETKLSSNFLILPNPVNNYLFIQNAVKYSFIITDITGKLIKQGVINKDKEEISMGDFPSGMYFIQMHSSSGIIQTLKFVKK